ncbi:unnamed protein product [Mytilus coruscus]|uniref:Vwde helical domain-containing protein n=1 Tax=Mytilus coruscus TaxID=42192 RepID=A0A6J8BMB4_MYTCO|nr:unnamed protein product [Mytilus coruscus]
MKQLVRIHAVITILLKMLRNVHLDIRLTYPKIVTPINDVFLSDGWYKVESSIESSMPREAPGPLKCGTCSPVDKSAYCFGSQKIPCPDGESSETGFYQDCSADYPKVTLIPTVVVDLILGPVIVEGHEESLQTAFSCQFDRVEEEYYDVHWYINEQTVTTYNNVLFDDIEDTNLTEIDWVGKYKLNMVVKCSVRLRKAFESTPGLEQTSVPYAAGLFKKSDPDEELYDEILCKGNVQQENLALEKQSCNIRIPCLAWNETIIINVTGYINGLYDSKDRISYLKLKGQIGGYTPGKAFPWDESETPEIKILVTDVEHTMAGRVCQSYNDPHFYTADRLYWDYYEHGEFILYRHKTLPYQVNALFGKCNSVASCNCGIAIRSGSSMFVVRTCDEITRYSTHTHSPLIEMRACDDATMTIEENGNTYTVNPSILDVENSEGLCGRITNGTRNITDDFTLRDGSTLHASYYNGYTFSRNWRVKESEQFFVDKPLILSENINLRQYCICGDSTPERETFRCGLEAPLQSCLSQTANAGHFHTTCSLLRRRRLINGNGTVSATDSDDVIDNIPLIIADDNELNGETPPETNTEWPAGWTKNLAQSTCESKLKQEILEEALEIAHTSIDGYIKTCMSDIQLAGDTRFLQDTISSVRQTVYSEIVRNQSLFTSSNTMTQRQNQQFLLLKCCSVDFVATTVAKTGKCQNGICKCNTGFGKQDCSEDLSTPPSNISIPLNGICNTRERLCAKTNIQGVFSSRNITCLSRHFQIRNDGSWNYTASQQMYAAEYKNTYLVACELPSSGRRKRSISTTVIADGYEINLSNDGTNFGEGVKIIIYDQDCFSCDIANLSCVSLDSCPDKLTSDSPTSSTVIEGGGNSPATTDTVSCTTTSAKTSTNMKTTTIPSTSTPFTNNVNNSSNSILIVGGCFGVLLFMVLVIGGFVFSKKNCKNKGCVQYWHGIENIIHEYTDDFSKGTNKSDKTPNQYQRENKNASVGNLSLDLETDTYSRPRTPVQLFLCWKIAL